MMRQAVLVFVLIFCTGCGSSPPPAIFLGHIAVRDDAAGKSAERAMRLALKEFGPTLSDALSRRPLVMRYVEAGRDLDSFEGEAARLVSVNKVAGLLGGATLEQALRLDRVRVPILSPIGTRTSAMSDMLFTTGLAPATQARMLAQFLAEQAPTGGILIIDPRRAEFTTLAEQFRTGWIEAWAKRDAKAEPPRWQELNLPPQESNLRQWAAENLIKKAPAAIVFAGNAADFDVLGSFLGDAAPLLAYLGTEGEWYSQTRGPPVHFATIFARGEGLPQIEPFLAKYREAFQTEPDLAAAMAYDNLRLFAEALKKAPADQPDKLREELLKITDFAGLTGPLSFTPEQQLRRPVFIARSETWGRPPVVVKSYEP